MPVEVVFGQDLPQVEASVVLFGSKKELKVTRCNRNSMITVDKMAAIDAR